MAQNVLSFFKTSTLLNSGDFAQAATRLSFADNRLGFGNVKVNSYFASVAVDYIRTKLLEQRISFTIETVMSHPSKISLLKQAQDAGYRTYLYFIATDDPEINISRVRNRVKLGGHDVPSNRIIARYHRSIGLLMEAIRHTNRTYLFDNSGNNPDRKHTWLAEITNGKELELKTDTIPAWFKRAVLDKIKQSL